MIRYVTEAIGTFFLLAQTPGKTVTRKPASRKSVSRKTVSSSKTRYALVGGAWLVAGLAVLVTEPWSRQLMTSGPYLGRQTGGSSWRAPGRPRGRPSSIPAPAPSTIFAW